jgi:hypothetical protein
VDEPDFNSEHYTRWRERCDDVKAHWHGMTETERSALIARVAKDKGVSHQDALDDSGVWTTLWWQVCLPR